MKYLGIDFGSKRVGLALSDENLQFAFPFKVLENSENLLEDIKKICCLIADKKANGVD